MYFKSDYTPASEVLRSFIKQFLELKTGGFWLHKFTCISYYYVQDYFYFFVAIDPYKNVICVNEVIIYYVKLYRVHPVAVK